MQDTLTSSQEFTEIKNEKIKKKSSKKFFRGLSVIFSLAIVFLLVFLVGFYLGNEVNSHRVFHKNTTGKEEFITYVYDEQNNGYMIKFLTNGQKTDLSLYDADKNKFLDKITIDAEELKVEKVDKSVVNFIVKIKGKEIKKPVILSKGKFRH